MVFTIPVFHTWNNFTENYLKYDHTPSEIFSSPVLGRIILMDVSLEGQQIINLLGAPACFWPALYTVISFNYKVNIKRTFLHAATAPSWQGFLFIEASRSYSDTPQPVGLLWTSDRPDAQTSTWQHTTLTTQRYQCPRRNSNPQSGEERH